MVYACQFSYRGLTIYIKGELTKSDGEISEVSDYFSMSTEKKDGEWFVTSVNIIP